MSEALNPQSIERVSPQFERQMFEAARTKSWALAERVAAAIKPGMSEAQALERCAQIFKESGVEKNWHRTRLCLGRNTLTGFETRSDPTVVLGEDDIFFMDLGPVFGGYEGDVGKTFTTGVSPALKKCAADAERIHGLVAAKWRESKLSGEKLYAFAAELTESMGWKLNLELNGHRLSDFPHAVYFKGAMQEVDFCPSPALWVLEIQIRHPTEDYGAFFEDLLV